LNSSIELFLFITERGIIIDLNDVDFFGEGVWRVVKMDKLFKQAQKMQAQMVQIQERLAEEKVEGVAGGGMVRVTANGQGELLSVTISPEVIDPQDPEMLEDLVLAATNEALRLSKELANQRMSQLAGGMGLNVPGLF
jgi:hypothetical protein